MRGNPGSQAPRRTPRSQHRRGESAWPAPSLLFRVALTRTPRHTPRTLTHRGGRAGLRAAQASLADIFLWEDFKRAVKARNYTGYKLWNPWLSRAPSPPRIRPLSSAQGQVPTKGQSTPADGVERWGEGWPRDRPKSRLPSDPGTLAELGWPGTNRSARTSGPARAQWRVSQVNRHPRLTALQGMTSRVCSLLSQAPARTDPEEKGGWCLEGPEGQRKSSAH